MSKIKLLTLTVIVLMLINIITLAFFFSKRPMNRKNPKEVVIEKLHFDEKQVATYNELIEIHSEEIKTLNDDFLITKNNLYKELSKSDNKMVTDSLLLQLATLQNEIEKTHYNHFLAIKKLCKPQQLNDYNALTNELSKIFSPKPPMDQNHEHHP